MPSTGGARAQWLFPLGGGYHQGAPAYFRYIRQWHNSGDFAGLQFSRT